MKVLLDTHLLLWWLAGDVRLPDEARRTIARGEDEVGVSVVSLWEIVLKTGKGKLRVDPDAVVEEIHRSQFYVLPVEARHALAYGRLPAHHHDPFDRMLIAQAQSESTPLLTHDPQLRQYGNAVQWV